MKCGLCGKDTMLGYHGEQRKIYDTSDLARHKSAEHKDEVLAAQAARSRKAATAKQEANRVAQARLAASRPVIARYRGSGTPSIFPSSRLRPLELKSLNGVPLSDVRFPDPARFSEYEALVAQIAEIQAQTQAVLISAWETGQPVPLEHLAELDSAAIEK